MRARICSFFRFGSVLALALTMASLGLVAQAQTRMTYKSALAGTAYHQMGSELAQAIRQGSDETLLLTNEESQGSVQNIQEVMNRQERYVFTAPPALVAQAQAGEGVFASHDSERFGAIRGLFPVPSLTMHFVMAGDDGTTSIDALSGKHVLIGRGTFSAGEAARYFRLFGLEDSVRLADASITNGPEALREGRIDAFVTASSYPTPNVIETASLVPITLVSFTAEQIAQTGAVPQVIPGGTYPGIAQPTHTTSMPVVAYTTEQMDVETAYRLTKLFWEQQPWLAEQSAWWGSVTPDLLTHLTTPLHPGARRYYEEAGMELPAHVR
ncbi:MULTISPECIES: TAXI family TRAP transporter solute-binding subunit [unclassified Halomonas]|uniref:TAXI family TRAP transporter solute-binding subunit n=1 Tax=unclassified Halomonas TaxID=2609666 RepID=UPI001EF6CC89|nr:MULTISPECIES: TAXI family TRAP transporter solute-binding subunit [unclassified Halomonas]MCG7577523.1 TAXI family TRAP transporter solute-binding subunit [Halomonas sp. MMH1-48]MCG7604606.1 TAXI family TRAP transporter solute-binding subunit [Halomonas sp. MM17-34]MCG7613722.1 TAXI family TRAP transporter solute-binding subunit [Halomonas sp. MM17-29]MCG7620629.1 TAXI family TRAP transporter solute-binding subunit [Halomonas sp. DSH1-27]